MTNLADVAYCSERNFIAANDSGNLTTYFIGKETLAHLSSGHLSWTHLANS